LAKKGENSLDCWSGDENEMGKRDLVGKKGRFVITTEETSGKKNYKWTCLFRTPNSWGTGRPGSCQTKTNLSKKKLSFAVHRPNAKGRARIPRGNSQNKCP